LKKEKTSKRAKAPDRPATGARKAAPVRGCLLLVEDHSPTRNGLQRLLAGMRFDVKAAASVEEAWELAKDTKFDALVSDIGLPDGDGYILMRELRDRYGLRGIALTGFDWENDVLLSREAGFSAHLAKPVAVKVLDQALAALGL
jgi:DNA-binding response OmpR family regulator